MKRSLCNFLFNWYHNIFPSNFLFCFLIWLQILAILFIYQKVGKNFEEFDLIKLRSMILNADKSGIDSTSNDDTRITKIGNIVRKYKLDELMQLLNVFGNMTLVGPRPNVKSEVDHTKEEQNLLKVKPGITDFASIVFSDEGEILKNKKNPDIAYNQLIRPGREAWNILH